MAIGPNRFPLESIMRVKKESLARTILISVCVLIVTAEAFPAKRPWQLEDNFKIKRISELECSPDGQELIFITSETDLFSARSVATLWSYYLDKGEFKSRLKIEGSIDSPRWSPDGTKIAFFTSEKGELSLWVMNRDGQDKKKLINLERSNAYIGMRGNELCWSPDGKKLAYNAAGPRYYDHAPSPLNPPTGNKVMVVERIGYKAFYYYSDMRRTYVYIIPAEGGKPEQVSFGDYDYHSLSWSPDGKWVACVSNRTGKDEFNHNNDICLLSLDGKKLIQLTKTIGPEYMPVWSLDGQEIAYLGRVRDKRSKESDAEFPKVYVIPAKGGQPINLTEPLDQWSQAIRWSKDSRQVYFTAQNKGRVCLYAAPRQGGKVIPLVEEYGQVGSYAVAPDGDIYYVYQDFTHPAEIYHLNVRTQVKKKLTQFNQEIVETIEMIEPERFLAKSFDDWEIEGWLMKPYGFKKGKRYPLILSIHGGPHAQYGYSLSPFFQYLAANGYAVMFTNPRGSSGYGQKFSDGCVGDLGGGDYQDIMACVDYVLKNHDFIDSKRLGVTGGSYGGYMTNWVITHTNRFKAAVSVASISNLISDWADANPDWFESDGGFMPFENYEKAWSMSPLKYVTNCQTPTLFIHGAWDFCVNLGEAEQMFVALRKLGVPTVLAIYPNEGHGLRQPEHVMDYYQRALAWFNKYLK